MKIFEDATRLVSLADIFSSNESFEEVPTENIKYLLLPALLGTLATKLCNADDRMHIVEIAEIYFVDFLKRLKAYGLIDIEIPDINQDDKKEESAIAHKKSNSELITEMVLIFLIFFNTKYVNVCFDAMFFLGKCKKYKNSKVSTTKRA